MAIYKKLCILPGPQRYCKKNLPPRQNQALTSEPAASAARNITTCHPLFMNNAPTPNFSLQLFNHPLFSTFRVNEDQINKTECEWREEKGKN